MKPKFRYDGVLAALVFLAATCVAFGFLQTQECTFLKERSVSARAVMVACGRGSGYPQESQVPGLSEFVNGFTPSFDPRNVPARLWLSEEESVGAYHRYLVYALGLLWRVFGISWGAVTYFRAVMFGATVALGYGLLRLGMNRFLSLLGAALFMVSPAMLMAAYDVRDFSKAPFLFGAILLMGRLAKSPVKTGTHWGLAALLGAVISIGMGFRQDVFICLPPAVLVVGLAASGESGFSIPRRAIALGLLLGSYFLMAWPMLTKMDQGGAQPYHTIIQGFCTESRENLGLQRAGYDPVMLSTDDYVLCTVASYDERLTGGSSGMAFDSPQAVQAGKQWVLEVARMFPADLITRAYAAVLWAMGDGGAHFSPVRLPDYWTSKIVPVYVPVSMHLYRHGVWYLALALIILSSRSIRLAGVLLFFLVYFCGYVSLDFEYRHAFHLCLVPLWIFGFLIGVLGEAIRRLMQAECRTRLKTVLADPRQWWGAPVQRIVVFCLGAGFVLLAPLGVARFDQHAVVGNLLDRYASADLEPVETVQEPLPLCGWTLFRPRDPGVSLTPWACGFKDWAFYLLSWCVAHDLPLGGELGNRCINLSASALQLVPPYKWEVHTGYLVAELSATLEERLLLVKYKPGNPRTDFSHVAMVNPAPGGTVKYFFPAYEFCSETATGGWDWSRFIGVALPQELAADFKGLYRVKNPDPFRILLSLSLPEDRSSFRRSSTMVRHAGFEHRNACADDAFGWAGRGRECWAHGQKDKALERYRAALALNPNLAAVWAELGIRFSEDGDVNAAVRALETAISQDPSFSPTCFQLDALLLTRNDPAGRTEVWRRIAAQHPDVPLAQVNLACALEAQGRYDEAVPIYRKSVAADPSNSAAQGMFGQALVRTGAYAEAIPVLQDLFQHHPDSDPFRWAFLKALTETGQYDAAREQVRMCRDRGVWLPPELTQTLEQKSGQIAPNP